MQTGLAVTFVFSDGLSTFEAVNAMTPTVPVLRDFAVNGFVLPDDVEIWSCGFRLHKLGSGTFEGDYEILAPTCYPGGSIDVGTFEPGMWSIHLNDWQLAWPLHDMPVVIIKKL